MGSIGDVYQLVDEQALESQKIVNVYFYRLDTPVVGNVAEMLSTSWIANVLPDVLAIQGDALSHRSVTVRNLFNESEAYTELISETGGYAGSDLLPTFNAVGFRLIGDNAAVRNGQKRFAGVPESAQTNSVVTYAPFLAQLATLAVTLAAGLPIGLDIDALIPVIVQRILVGSNYELPSSAGEAVLSEVIDALFNVDVTSQTSRKIGRGE